MVLRVQRSDQICAHTCAQSGQGLAHIHEILPVLFWPQLQQHSNFKLLHILLAPKIREGHSLLIVLSLASSTVIFNNFKYSVSYQFYCVYNMSYHAVRLCKYFPCLLHLCLMPICCYRYCVCNRVKTYYLQSRKHIK